MEAKLSDYLGTLGVNYRCFVRDIEENPNGLTEATRKRIVAKVEEHIRAACKEVAAQGALINWAKFPNL